MAAPSAGGPANRGPGVRRSVPAVATITLAFLLVVLLSPRTAVLLAFESTYSLLVLLPPTLAGLRLLSLFRLGPMSRSWQLLLGAALGLGSTSLLVLILGWAGVLHRPVWIAVLVLLAAAGVIRFRALLAEEQGLSTSPIQADSGRRAGWLWLLAGPFLTLALLAASFAPGFLWAEEGFGYDVLEYHLQMPREYLEAGRIFYAPHNVYANFPAATEMLYLLVMLVQSKAVEAGIGAQLVHLAFGVLFVLAGAAAGGQTSRLGGVLGGLTAASCGWLVYLSGLAYVENAMLFFGCCAATVLLRPSDAAHEGNAVLAGVLAGFACGCKYTAVAMIALPLAIANAMFGPGSRRVRAVRTGWYLLAAGVAFSPWLVKNAVMTGNPVFPLANGLFEAAPPGWTGESDARWQRGHAAAAHENNAAGVAGAFAGRVLLDARFGPAVWLVPLAGLAWRRLDRVDVALLATLGIQVALWALATHLYARFAVVFLIPLVLLAGRAGGGPAASGPRAWTLIAVLIAGGAWNLFASARRLLAEAPAGILGGLPAHLWYTGEVPGYEYYGTVNQELPDSSRVLLVGEARPFYFLRPVDYCVVFNHCGLAGILEEAGGDPGRVVRRLGERGFTHLLVHWQEIRRLRNSAYGFPPEIDAEFFNRLERGGLRIVREYAGPNPAVRYVTLYQIAN